MKKVRFFLGLVMAVILCASCASNSSVENRFGPYSEAEGYYQKGKYGEAAAQYEKYLSENPQGSLATVASYYLAKCYASLGKTDAAKAGFQKIIADSPKTTWADFSKKQLEILGA